MSGNLIKSRRNLRTPAQMMVAERQLSGQLWGLQLLPEAASAKMEEKFLYKCNCATSFPFGFWHHTDSKNALRSDTSLNLCHLPHVVLGFEAVTRLAFFTQNQQVNFSKKTTQFPTLVWVSVPAGSGQEEKDAVTTLWLNPPIVSEHRGRVKNTSTSGKKVKS